ncbi:hypothetical protein EV645_0985 [Kribbella rubisoli]|uniref:Uncharacterized protein n=1 Tax=Kribbella rubisoli TaxID=3075929 RepID=A0A4V2FYS7_9ACTN|nr:hypothetical protein [Kribbella rubisoli]RZU18786.1 hypothetical protein EV645_0985 [Kribbella rubisoli]
MATERRDQLLADVEHPEGRDRLRAVVKCMLDEATTDAVLEDLEQIRGLVSPANEDKVLDVMDLLAGWLVPTTVPADGAGGAAT